MAKGRRPVQNFAPRSLSSCPFGAWDVFGACPISLRFGFIETRQEVEGESMDNDNTGDCHSPYAE